MDVIHWFEKKQLDRVTNYSTEIEIIKKTRPKVIERLLKENGINEFKTLKHLERLAEMRIAKRIYDSKNVVVT